MCFESAKILTKFCGKKKKLIKEKENARTMHTHMSNKLH